MSTALRIDFDPRRKTIAVFTNIFFITISFELFMSSAYYYFTFWQYNMTLIIN